MKLNPYLRIIRIKLVLAITIATALICIKYKKDLFFTFLAIFTSFLAVSHVNILSEINDVNVDSEKYKIYDFYRLNPNPLVTGELSFNQVRKLLYFTFITSFISAIILSVVYAKYYVILFGLLSYILIRVYICIDRGIIGNICQSISAFLLFLAFSRKLLFSALVVSLYIFVHNVNNQIEDYEAESNFYKTIPVQIGVKNSKILGILLSIFGVFISYMYFFPFILPFITLIPIFLTNNKSLMDRIRAINYLLFTIAFVFIK